jgi:3alpha(or 20beta)-hydroxysteroid dehydrogenase
MNRVSNKIVLISGSARGMGAEEARLFISEGAKVVIGDLRVEEGQQLAQQLGNNAEFVKLDVTKQGDWKATIALCEKKFGHINVLVNNAGINNYAMFEEYTQDQLKQVLDVNLFGNFNSMKAVTQSMKASGGGSIVNISSVAGITGYPLFPAIALLNGR